MVMSIPNFTILLTVLFILYRSMQVISDCIFRTLIIGKNIFSTVFQKVADCDHILKYSNCSIVVIAIL